MDVFDYQSVPTVLLVLICANFVLGYSLAVAIVSEPSAYACMDIMKHYSNLTSVCIRLKINVRY